MASTHTNAIITAIAALSLMLGIAACESEPRQLPTEAAVENLDRNAQPPLYQLLYDIPALPAFDVHAQRVRILIWLRHLKLSEGQLSRLDALRALTDNRRARIGRAEEEASTRWSSEEAGIYQEIWTHLQTGGAVDDPNMAAFTHKLKEMRTGGERERELLKLRLQGIRAVFEAQRDFLATLSPTQEALLADAVFFLRNRLDPIGNPGDFRALVGTIYDPGQYAVLTRGSSDWARAPLNIGGLWSDAPQLEGGALHEARREVLLYLILLEPALAEAITAAANLKTPEAAP
jgi:hypothetical protein